MTELRTFNYNENQVRTVEKNGEPWFVLKDVCNILNIGNSSDVYSRLDVDEKGVEQIDTLGGAQKMSIISESGLYNVILRSDKPEAKPFRKWVTSEVLPSIRKHGAYATPEMVDKMLADPDSMIKVLKALKQERDARRRLEAQAEQDKPKVLFAESVETATTSILVGDMAKLLRQNGLEIGQKRLFEYLRNNGYLIKRRGESYNMPTQRSLERGWMEIKERTVLQPDGSTRITRTPKITGKGQVYFVNLMLAN